MQIKNKKSFDPGSYIAADLFRAEVAELVEEFGVKRIQAIRMETLSNESALKRAKHNLMELGEEYHRARKEACLDLKIKIASENATERWGSMPLSIRAGQTLEWAYLGLKRQVTKFKNSRRILQDKITKLKRYEPRVLSPEIDRIVLYGISQSKLPLAEITSKTFKLHRVPKHLVCTADLNPIKLLKGNMQKAVNRLLTITPEEAHERVVSGNAVVSEGSVTHKKVRDWIETAVPCRWEKLAHIKRLGKKHYGIISEGEVCFESCDFDEVVLKFKALERVNKISTLHPTRGDVMAQSLGEDGALKSFSIWIPSAGFPDTLHGKIWGHYFPQL